LAEPEPTVFIVDDEPAIVEAVAEAVELMGLKPAPYGSADAFLAAYQRTGPACLVLNVTMPGKSGLQLQKELAAAGSTLPIIMITGYADVRMAVEAMKAGAFEFLEKPFRTQELCDSIERAIKLDAENWKEPEP